MLAVSEESNGGLSQPVPLRGGGWPILLVLAAIQFIHILDFIILMPLGPRLLRELDITPKQFGLLVSVYAFGACAAGLLGASWVDRFDRKRALLGLYAGFTLATLFCALAPSYEALLVARFLTGAFGGVLGALCLAIVGDVFPEHRRGRAVGVLMSSYSVATIAGVPAGLALARLLGTAAPFAVLAGLSAALWLLAAVCLPALRRHLGGGNRPIALWKVFLLPAHLRAFALMICLVLSTFMIVPYLATYLVVNLGWSEGDLPLLYLFGGAATIVTMSLFGRLADRHGKLPVFRVLGLTTAVPLVLLTNLPVVPLAVGLVVTTLYMVVASGRMVPAVALMTSSARPADRGSFLSVLGAVQQMAAGLASLLAGGLLHQPVANGPLEGFPLIGLLGCVACAASVVLAGAVRPAAGEAEAGVGEVAAEPAQAA
jgi:predicted MFS family arabinose efflux permease